MDHKSCIEGIFDPSNPHRERFFLLKLFIYSWVSTNADWFFLFKIEIDVDLFRKLS